MKTDDPKFAFEFGALKISDGFMFFTCGRKGFDLDPDFHATILGKSYMSFLDDLYHHEKSLKIIDGEKISLSNFIEYYCCTLNFAERSLYFCNHLIDLFADYRPVDIMEVREIRIDDQVFYGTKISNQQKYFIPVSGSDHTITFSWHDDIRSVLNFYKYKINKN